MNVLVIPEDFRKDQYMLKPIILAMMSNIGKPRAKVRVCQDPLLGGVVQATKWERMKEIVDRYAMVNLFVLCVDRDGVEGRRASLDFIEENARNELGFGRFFVAENAWQEIEVWVLAGHDLPPEWSWQEIRKEKNPKEEYFIPYSEQRGLSDEPGQGRRTLAREAARRYERIRKLCT